MKRLIRANTEYEAGGETFDGYMGAVGWKGKNVDAHLSVVDIAKIIKSQFKKRYPGYKISARTERYSSIRIVVTIPKSDLMPKDEFVDICVQNPYKYFGHQTWVGGYDENGKYINFRPDEFSKMSDEERFGFFSRYYDHTIDRYTNGEYDTINYGHEPIPLLKDDALKYVYDLMKSFTYRDTNAMVDYFDQNFYGFLYYKYGA